MSPESRRRRFLGPKPVRSERELTMLTDVDHVSHEALVAVAVIDDWQGRRLGTRLAIQTLQRAKPNGFSLITGTTFWDNRPARRMMRTPGLNTVGYDGALLDMGLRLA